MPHILNIIYYCVIVYVVWMECSRPVVAPRETKFTRVKGYLRAHNIRSYKYIIFHAWNIEWWHIFYFLFHFIDNALRASWKDLTMRFILTRSCIVSKTISTIIFIFIFILTIKTSITKLLKPTIKFHFHFDIIHWLWWFDWQNCSVVFVFIRFFFLMLLTIYL